MTGPAAARPVIGISCYVERASRGDWVDQDSVVLPYGYVQHVEAAGGIGVVLPPRHDADEGVVGSVLDRLDGVIIAGGADVEASRYGAQRHPSMQEPRPDRDTWELALAAATAQRGMPVLGICRGMQVLAVAAGGVLEQHLPDRVGHEAHSPTPGAYSSHHVVPVAGTRLAELLGEDSLDVPTYHHQAVVADSLPHTAYVPSAWHEDGTLEAMEDPSAPFRLAVQWHPEAGADGRLFTALVEACGAIGWR